MILTCSYHATWTSFTVSHGRNGCSTLVAIYIQRFWAKMSRHDFEIVTQLLKKWFSQIWNEITISTYLSKSVETLSYWHCSLVCNVFEMVTGPIKVNQEFSFFWFVQFQVCWTRFSSGLNPNIYSGFKPEIHFSCLNFSYELFSQQLLNASLCFSTRLSSEKPSFELLSQLSGSAI